MSVPSLWLCTLPLALLACTSEEKAPSLATGALAEDGAQDNDGDGFFGDDDCNDNDASVGPGAVEICDGIDNNCNGSVDEGVTQDFFVDADGDGFGDEGAVETACAQPAGTVPNSNDCDDDDASIFPGAPELCNGIDENCSGEADEGLTGVWFPDADMDGYGDDAGAVEGCEPEVGWVDRGGDCNDSEPDAFPGNPEVCDEVDNDCDTEVDEGLLATFYIDRDGDGWGDSSNVTESCLEPEGYAERAGDCDDGAAAVNPDSTEWCDGVDNDCDGDTDEADAADALTWVWDGDGDGFGGTTTTAACEAPAGYLATGGAVDCDDGSATVYPGATETCDGEDDDCDGTIDEDDAVDALTWFRDSDGDGYGDPDVSTVSCSVPSGYVSSSTDCDDGSASVSPAETEICNGIDDDCDNDIDDDDTSVVGLSTWYADDDGDSFGDPARPQDACSAPSDHVANNTDCDDGSAAVFPGATEVCNGVDDDCDLDVDDDDSSVTGLLTWYADLDGDSYGDPDNDLDACEAPTSYVADDTDCDDGVAGVNPGETEICNGIDDDCDNDIDDDDGSVVGLTTFYADLDGDTYGDASSPTEACVAPGNHVTDDTDCDDGDGGVYPGAPEVCNGDDDDCDGVIDNGVLGTAAACPAEDCAEILADNPSASDGSYELDFGTYTCDMTTDGGGWTLVGNAAAVYGTGYSGTAYNSEGFYWTEALFTYHSGSVHAHCTYPSSLTGCNNIGMQFGSATWAVAANWGSSLCGMSVDTSYTSATTYIGGYDWVMDRSGSTDTIRVGTLEGIASCTTSDNPGTAYMDIWVRN